LRDPLVATILVEHRDRFARLGAEYVEAALAAQGRRLVVVDPLTEERVERSEE
jgi:predicted site-specific integrase-resolvase